MSIKFLTLPCHMKKAVRIYLMILGAAACATACDSFLDTTPDDVTTPDELFETERSTEGVLMGAYSYLRTDAPWNPEKGSYIEGSSSDVDYAWTNWHTFNQGVWSASDNYGHWDDYYKGIHQATFFLQNLDKCTVMSSSIRERLRAEGRCLRALFYANLMRMYGPVILLKDELVDFTGTNLSRPRSTWDECVDWVCNEFLEVSRNPDLPLKQTGEYYARMSRSIALGYRARLLLQSASPQFNGNPMYAGVCNKDGTHLFPLEEDPSKWELARQAAKDLIDLGVYELVKVTGDDGRIDPYESYKGAFTQRTNSEMIFPYLDNDGRFDLHIYPNSKGGWGGYGVTQEMVDLYAMDNGRYPINGYSDEARMNPVIDEKSGYSESGSVSFEHPIAKTSLSTQRMYVNREPRFYVSVYYGCTNGLPWFVSTRPDKQSSIEMYYNGADGPGNQHNYYSTGYAMIKLLPPDFSRNPNVNTKHEIPYMRYAEILLDYIEATIECGRTDRSKLEDADMLECWNGLRERAGLPPILEAYPEAAGDYAMLRDLVRRERRVELAFEAHSFFDTRRWLTASESEGGDFHGMNTSAQQGLYPTVRSYPAAFFRRTFLETRVFTPSFYLFPIPQSAINKNRELVQNYKW